MHVGALLNKPAPPEPQSRAVMSFQYIPKAASLIPSILFWSPPPLDGKTSQWVCRSGAWLAALVSVICASAVTPEGAEGSLWVRRRLQYLLRWPLWIQEALGAAAKCLLAWWWIRGRVIKRGGEAHRWDAFKIYFADLDLGQRRRSQRWDWKIWNWCRWAMQAVLFDRFFFPYRHRADFTHDAAVTLHVSAKAEPISAVVLKL